MDRTTRRFEFLAHHPTIKYPPIVCRSLPPVSVQSVSLQAHSPTVARVLFLGEACGSPSPVPESQATQARASGHDNLHVGLERKEFGTVLELTASFRVGIFGTGKMTPSSGGGRIGRRRRLRAGDCSVGFSEVQSSSRSASASEKGSSGTKNFQGRISRFSVSAHLPLSRLSQSGLRRHSRAVQGPAKKGDPHTTGEAPRSATRTPPTDLRLMADTLSPSRGSPEQYQTGLLRGALAPPRDPISAPLFSTHDRLKRGFGRTRTPHGHLRRRAPPNTEAGTP